MKKLQKGVTGNFQNPKAIAGTDYIEGAVNLLSFCIKIGAVCTKEGPPVVLEYLSIASLIIATIGKIVAKHIPKPWKTVAETCAIFPPIFEAVAMALREMDFAAKKAATTSGRFDTAASAVMILVCGLKWVPDAPDSWKPEVKDLIELVIPVGNSAPFQQLMYTHAFVAILSMRLSHLVINPADMLDALTQACAAEPRTAMRRRNSWNGRQHSCVASGVSV